MAWTDTTQHRLEIEGFVTAGVCGLLLILHVLQVIAENRRTKFCQAVQAAAHPRDGFIPHMMRRLLPVVTLMLLLRIVRVFSSQRWAIIVYELSSNNATIFSVEIVLIFAWSLIKQQQVVDISCLPEPFVYLFGVVFLVVGNATVVASAVYDRKWWHAIFLFLLGAFGVIADVLLWIWVLRLNAFINRLKEAEAASHREKARTPVVREVYRDGGRRGSYVDLERAPMEMSVSRSNSRSNSNANNSNNSRTAKSPHERFPPPIPFDSPEYGAAAETRGNVVDHMTLSDEQPSPVTVTAVDAAAMYGTSVQSNWSGGAPSSNAVRLQSHVGGGGGGGGSGAQKQRTQRLGDMRAANDDAEHASQHDDGVRTIHMASFNDDPAAFPSRRKRGPLARVVAFLVTATILTMTMCIFLYFDARDYLKDTSKPFWSTEETHIQDMSSVEDAALFGLRFAWVFFLTFYSWGPIQDAWAQTRVDGLVYSVSGETAESMTAGAGAYGSLVDGSDFDDEHDQTAFHALPGGDGSDDY